MENYDVSQASLKVASTDVEVFDIKVESAAIPTKKILKVRKKTSSKVKNMTNFQMMVESGNNENLSDFDKNKIASALEKELGLSIIESNEIARLVEKSLLKSDMHYVTTNMIREVVNSILLERGHSKELSQHSNLSIPLQNVNEMFFNPNQENSNTAFSPEANNLLLSGSLKKQFALRKVFSNDVAEAHLKGEIHLHDLDFIDRPYAFEGNKSIVLVRVKDTDEVFEVCMEELYSRIDVDMVEKIQETDGAITIKSNTYELLDKDGKWTDLISLTKIPHTKDIYEVELETGEKVYVTEEHPCIVINENGEEEIKRTDMLLIGDGFYVGE